MSGSLPAATSRLPRATCRSRRRAAWPSQAAVSTATSAAVCPIRQHVQVGAARAEQRLLLGPLALDRQRRAEHQGGGAEPPDHLQADHGLARARRGDDQGLVAPGGAVGLERLQAQRLVAAPLPGELPCGERRGLVRHHTRVREAPDASVAIDPAG
jgi:hypothetical protein